MLQHNTPEAHFSWLGMFLHHNPLCDPLPTGPLQQPWAEGYPVPSFQFLCSQNPLRPWVRDKGLQLVNPWAVFQSHCREERSQSFSPTPHQLGSLVGSLQRPRKEGREHTFAIHSAASNTHLLQRMQAEPAGVTSSRKPWDPRLCGSKPLRENLVPQPHLMALGPGKRMR